ncbi:MAG: hypothetical protein QW292_14675 [Candidatus Parvarchaeota archaeon]
MVGLDLSINHFVVDSDNNFVDNPRFLDETSDKIAAFQRILASRFFSM